MTGKDRPSFIDDAIASYIVSLSTKRETPSQKNLRDATRQFPLAFMQIGVDQAQLMGMLTLLCNTTRAIEVGVFTGYSALCVAKHLPENGWLVACDISAETTAIGESHWVEAGVRDRVDLRLGPAVNTLDALISEGESGTFDFAFLDADKTLIDRYYEQCLELLRPGGLIAVDNAFLFGRVLNPSQEDADALAMRSLTEKVFDDDRVYPALIAIGDGLLLARKKS